jgi:erythromycin esterase-like protein
MAANVIALSSLTGQRSAVWAHNQHIARYDPAVDYASERRPAGEQLQQTFKDQYYPIGFLFEQGSFLAIERKKRDKGFYYPNFRVFHFTPNKGSALAATLSGLTGSSFFLDLSKSTNPVWKKFHPFYTVGSIYYKNANRVFYLAPGNTFSALVFVPTTTPIVELDDHFNPTED